MEPTDEQWAIYDLRRQLVRDFFRMDYSPEERRCVKMILLGSRLPDSVLEATSA